MLFSLHTFSSLLAVLIILRLAATLFRAARNSLSSVPGPWYTKYTSLVLKFFWLRGERAKYVEQLHQRYGPVVRLSPTEVDFCTVTAARTIHSYRKSFPKGEMYRRISTIKGMENVFSTTDSSFHARHRRLLSAPLSESSLKQFEEVVADKAELAVQRMGEDMKKRGAADVLKWWLFMATDIIGELSFGDSFRMLELGKKNQYAEDLGKVAFLTGLRISFPTLIHISSYIPISFLRRPYDAAYRMKAYAEESVQRYQRSLLADPHNSKPTLFAKLYRAGEEGLSPKEIVAEAQAYIVAGSDTTAISLTYLVWAVCKDNNVKRKLVEEMGGLPDGYTHEDLKAAPYLNNVIHETLRLYAAAPSGLPREVPMGGAEIDGYWMPGGTTVCTQAYSMHRDPNAFPQPERFNPSRWENASTEMNDMWMPFGGGSRVCLGLHLALMELRIAAARFFRAFPQARHSTADGFSDKDMVQVIYFLMSPKNKRCLIRAS